MFEVTIKDIPVEQYELAFDFFIVCPESLENCTLTVVVSSFPIFSALVKISNVFIFIGIFQFAESFKYIIREISNINTSIA